MSNTQHINNMLYFESYLSNRGNEVQALQFNDVSKDAVYHDVKRHRNTFSTTAEFEYGKPVLTYHNAGEGVKHVVRFGDYVVLNNGYFTVIEESTFNHNYNKLETSNN